MIPKSLQEITFADIQSLIENKVQENKTIEYKRELPDNSDRDKIHFLSGVSALANTSGGDLIIGIEEENGAPVSIPGIETENLDQEILRLEDIIRNGTEPRITDFHTKGISTPDENYVLLIRINRSWSAPHKVSYKNRSKFYGRSSASVQPMDVEELRRAFTLSGLISDRIQRFREERVTALLTGRALPVTLADGGILALCQGQVHESRLPQRISPGILMQRPVVLPKLPFQKGDQVRRGCM
jgi:hypothetical protein